MRRIFALFLSMTIAVGVATPIVAAEGEKAVVRDYSLVRAAASPRTQDWDAADARKTMFWVIFGRQITAAERS